MISTQSLIYPVLLALPGIWRYTVDKIPGTVICGCPFTQSLTLLESLITVILSSPLSLSDLIILFHLIHFPFCYPSYHSLLFLLLVLSSLPSHSYSFSILFCLFHVFTFFEVKKFIINKIFYIQLPSFFLYPSITSPSSFSILLSAVLSSTSFSLPPTSLSCMILNSFSISFSFSP